MEIITLSFVYACNMHNLSIDGTDMKHLKIKEQHQNEKKNTFRHYGNVGIADEKRHLCILILMRTSQRLNTVHTTDISNISHFKMLRHCITIIKIPM